MVLVLSGPVRAGKTTFVARRLPLWRARGLDCGGFLSVAAGPSGGDGYDLVSLEDGGRGPFLRRADIPGAERTGPFALVPETLELARSLVRAARPGRLLVVDEVGPLELRGGGLWPALAEALGRPGTEALLVARVGVAAELAAALAPAVPRVVDVRDPAAGRLLDERLFGRRGSDDRRS